MASVTLIDRGGAEWEVRTPAALTEAVFRDGMRPKAGTLQENMVALALGFVVAPSLNDPVLKRDLDTDGEREAFLPARLSTSALDAKYGGGGGGGSGVAPSRSPVASTANPAEAFVGQWARVSQIRLTGQYQDAVVALGVTGFGSGNAAATAATLIWRVKQQAAMGAAPVGSLYVFDTVTLTPGDFAAVVEVNSPTETVVGLYARAGIAYETLNFYERAVTYEIAVTHYTNAAFVGASLPTGTGLTFPGIATPSSGLDANAAVTAVLASGQVARADEVQTLEELFAAGQLTGSVTAGLKPVFIARYPLTVTSLSLAFADGPTEVISEDLNYFTFTLFRLRAGVETAIAARGTRNNSSLNAAFPRRADWNFDNIAFDPAAAACLKGDVIGVRVASTGTPGTIGGMSMSIGYQPV